jgi:hypothetical protein
VDGHATEAGVLVPRGVGVVCIISASQKVNTYTVDSLASVANAGVRGGAILYKID